MTGSCQQAHVLEVVDSSDTYHKSGQFEKTNCFPVTLREGNSTKLELIVSCIHEIDAHASNINIEGMPLLRQSDHHLPRFASFSSNSFASRDCPLSLNRKHQSSALLANKPHAIGEKDRDRLTRCRSAS
jgi:hypothetical protein